jgi:hypothetical protein
MSKVSSFSERPDLRPIYDDYRHRLLENEYASVKAFKYVLRSRPPKSEVTGKKFLKKSLKTILRSQPFGFQTFQKRIAQFILDSLK